MPLTVLRCPSAIQTTSRWNSSRHPRKTSLPRKGRPRTARPTDWGRVLGGGGWAAGVADGAQVGEAGQVEGALLAVDGVGDLELQGSGAWARDQWLDDGGDPGGLARAERDRIRDDPVIVKAAGIPAPGQHLEQAGHEGHRLDRFKQDRLPGLVRDRDAELKVAPGLRRAGARILRQGRTEADRGWGCHRDDGPRDEAD